MDLDLDMAGGCGASSVIVSALRQAKSTLSCRSVLSLWVNVLKCPSRKERKIIRREERRANM